MKSIFTVLLLFVLASALWAEDAWVFKKVLVKYDLPVDNAYGMHGVAVDPNGNIWFGMYNWPTDSILVDTTYVKVYGMRVVDPDGNELSFSPVNVLSGAVTDTLDNKRVGGIITDKDGNILFSTGGKIYRINYQTGEGMNVFDFPGYDYTLAKAGVDDNGNIYVGVVGKGYPVIILNPDFTVKGNAIDTLTGTYNRAIAVTPDGKDMYCGSTWMGLGVRHFHSDIPGVLPFTPVDTLGNAIIEGVFDTTMTVACDTTISGTDTTITCDTTYTYTPHEEKFWAEDVTMGPDGILYAADTQRDFGPKYRGSRYYAFDVATGQELYSIGEPEGDPDAGGIWNGRGLAWSADGNTMYMADFGYNQITVWEKQTGIHGDQPNALTTFELLQNYPNPFNPTTTIPFKLAKRSKVELNLYTLTGQLVKTLINEEMNAGPHQYNLNASKLASGTYIYQLKFNGKVQSKRMILVK